MNGGIRHQAGVVSRFSTRWGFGITFRWHSCGAFEIGRGIVFYLNHSPHKSGRIEKDPRQELLSNAQLRCIVAVARYMAAIAFERDDDSSLDDWTRAIEHFTPAIQGPT